MIPTKSERLLTETAAWPERWRYDENDIALGKAIVAAMTPFLEHLAGSDAAETTIRRHFGNAWVLGGEIVRAAQMDPGIRRMKGARLLLRFVEEEGGLSCMATRARRNSDRSTPRVGNSGAS